MTTDARRKAPAPAPAPVEMRLAHLCAGRARLRLAGPAGEDAFRRLADALALGPRVSRVLARPATGSVIVEATADAETLRTWLETEPALKLLPPAPPPPPADQVARLGLMRLDAGLRARTEGVLGYRAALAGLLLVAAAIQLRRGQIAGPATTLLMSALALIDANGR